MEQLWTAVRLVKTVWEARQDVLHAQPVNIFWTQQDHAQLLVLLEHGSLLETQLHQQHVFLVKTISCNALIQLVSQFQQLQILPALNNVMVAMLISAAFIVLKEWLCSQINHVSQWLRDAQWELYLWMVFAKPVLKDQSIAQWQWLITDLRSWLHNVTLWVVGSSTMENALILQFKDSTWINRQDGIFHAIVNARLVLEVAKCVLHAVMD